MSICSGKRRITTYVCKSHWNFRSVYINIKRIVCIWLTDLYNNCCRYMTEVCVDESKKLWDFWQKGGLRLLLDWTGEESVSYTQYTGVVSAVKACIKGIARVLVYCVKVRKKRWLIILVNAYLILYNLQFRHGCVHITICGCVTKTILNQLLGHKNTIVRRIYVTAVVM